MLNLIILKQKYNICQSFCAKTKATNNSGDTSITVSISISTDSGIDKILTISIPTAVA